MVGYSASLRILHIANDFEILRLLNFLVFCWSVEHFWREHHWHLALYQAFERKPSLAKSESSLIGHQTCISPHGDQESPEPDFLSKWSVTCIKMTIIILPELQWLLYVDLRLAYQYQFPFQQWLLSWCDRTFDFGMEIRHSWHFNNICSRATTCLYYLWPVASWNAGLYV